MAPLSTSGPPSAAATDERMDKIQSAEKEQKKKAEQKMALAIVHYNAQILIIIQRWSMWVQIQKEKMTCECKSLQDLNLSECQGLNELSQFAVSEFSSLQKIHRQRFTVPGLWNRMSQAHLFGPEIAFRCHQLTYLNLRHCENVTDAGIEALGNTSSLMSIDISATNISDMPVRFQEFTKFELQPHSPSIITTVSTSGFQTLLKCVYFGLRALGCCGKIKQLSLSECKHVSDTGIQEFCKGTKHLEYCHVSNCPQLTDEAVKYLALYCHRLASVSIACCPKMTDTYIQYLATACLYLHFLDVSGCINLTKH